MPVNCSTWNSDKITFKDGVLLISSTTSVDTGIYIFSSYRSESQLIEECRYRSHMYMFTLAPLCPLGVCPPPLPSPSFPSPPSPPPLPSPPLPSPPLPPSGPQGMHEEVSAGSQPRPSPVAHHRRPILQGTVTNSRYHEQYAKRHGGEKKMKRIGEEKKAILLIVPSF